MTTRFSKGQMKMGLAAELHRGGLDAATSLSAAMEILDALQVPPAWRERLGAAVSDAINDDLRDPATWRRPDR